MADRPLVAVIGTGGTISSLGRDSTDVLDYPDFGTKLSVEKVIERYPEIASVADVLPVPFRSVGSTAIGPPNGSSLPPSSIASPPSGRRSRVSSSRTELRRWRRPPTSCI